MRIKLQKSSQKKKDKVYETFYIIIPAQIAKFFNLDNQKELFLFFKDGKIISSKFKPSNVENLYRSSIRKRKSRRSSSYQYYLTIPLEMVKQLGLDAQKELDFLPFSEKSEIFYLKNT